MPRARTPVLISGAISSLLNRELSSCHRVCIISQSVCTLFVAGYMYFEGGQCMNMCYYFSECVYTLLCQGTCTLSFGNACTCVVNIILQSVCPL